MAPEIEFCGEVIAIDRDPFVIGRDADLALEAENRHLHRRFLSVSARHGLWMLRNIGSQLTATVSDVEGRLQAFLAPGAVIPLVFEATLVRFTAGPTTYEFTIRLAEPPFTGSALDQAIPGSTPAGAASHGDTTVSRVSVTPDQLRLVLALAEPVLRGEGRATSTLRSNRDVARRLGWTLPRFNRKLDNLCQLLAAHGVRGLHGGPGHLASNRRARLVEYALAVRMVTRDDLALLDRVGAGHDGAQRAAG